ncbi:ANTAR domain-containing protein [Streptomyces violascens]|uniref:ANTAR domain-containing protein n=1 Tax=Streptomyces violascens TaxID=67381 RepID=UPI00378AE09D
MATPHQQLADALLALAAEPSDTLKPGEFLETLCVHSVELLGVDAAGAVLVEDGRNGRQVGASDPDVARLERDAAEWRQGPAHDCQSSGAALPEAALDQAVQRARWPRYAPRALALGHGRVTALPLYLRDACVGSLVLLRGGGTPLPPDKLALGRALADAAAISLLRENQLHASRTLTTQLEHALTSRITVEQAKGILATRMGVTVDEAFDAMRRYARSHRLKVATAALDIVAGRPLPDWPYQQGEAPLT